MFSRLRKTLTRTSMEPVSRVLQIDVANKRVCAVFEETIKETYGVSPQSQLSF